MSQFLRLNLLILVLLIFLQPSFAQMSIKGIVVDQSSGLPIESVSLSGLSVNKNAVSKTNGVFLIENVQTDSVLFAIRHVSYRADTLWISAKAKDLIIELAPLVIKLDNISVSAMAQRKNQISVDNVILGIKEIEALPIQLGEVDVLKALEIQPGVFRTSELSSAINVRGGSGGHNSFLLDGQTIFNPNHLLGFMSTFNADLIEGVEMSKSGYHPNLGGSLSSFIQVYNRIGNTDRYKGKIGIGLLSSRLMIEGPIRKKKSSFIIGLRKSYFDLFTKTYNRIYEGEIDFTPLPEYNYYDFQFKLHSSLGPKSFIEFIGFNSSDKLDLIKESSKKLNTSWSNKFLALHLKHYHSGKSYFSFNSGLSSYSFDLDRDFHSQLLMRSDIYRWNNSFNWEKEFSKVVNISSGVFFDRTWYRHNNRKLENQLLLEEQSEKLQSIYTGAYIQSEIKLSSTVKFNLGLRLNSFFQDKWFLKPAPRLVLAYAKNNGQINLTYARTYQFDHLITAYGMNLPNDIWYPSGNDFPEESSDQVTLGAKKKFSKTLRGSISLFYRKMNHQFDYKEGADIVFESVTEQILIGKGEAKGIEANFNLSSGNIVSNINYTLADTWRKTDGINNGQKYNPSFDITHHVNVLFQYKIKPNLSFCASWFFASGQYITYPQGLMLVQGFGNDIAKQDMVPLYDKRNNVQMPSTHRLDISLNYSKEHSKGRSTVSIGVYNVYNKSNPYFVYFDTEKSEMNSTRIVPKQKSMIPFLPSFNYSYEFK